jgi:hypothetical protein
MVTHRIEYVTIHLSASLQRTASFLGFVCAHPIRCKAHLACCFVIKQAGFSKLICLNFLGLDGRRWSITCPWADDRLSHQ